MYFKETMNDKSSENFDAANLLVHNDMLAASIHCYYYSCFQLSKYALNKSGFSYSNQDEGSGLDSHYNVIEKTSNLLEEYGHLKYLDYHNYMGKLKKMRRKADYSVEVIKTFETTSARNWAETVNNILNTTIAK